MIKFALTILQVTMITTDQLRGLQERKEALRRHL